MRALVHIPLDFGAVMKRNVERIEAADAKDPEFRAWSFARSGAVAGTSEEFLAIR